jgi:hypothetical protein
MTDDQLARSLQLLRMLFATGFPAAFAFVDDGARSST